MRRQESIQKQKPPGIVSIKHIQLLRAGFGLQRWKGSRTNPPKTNGRDGAVAELHGADGAVEYDVLNTKSWPKGDEAAEICQNPAGSCTRSSALAVGICAWAGGGQDPAVPSRHQQPWGRNEGCSSPGWSTQPSRTTPINTEKESREDNTGKQKGRTGQEEAGEGIR